MIAFAEPKPPTDVSFTVLEKDLALVTWAASQSMCDSVVRNYSVRYTLKGTSISYTTVYTKETRAVLQGLVPNAEYTVSVAAINSLGDMSAHSATTMAAPAVTLTQSKYFDRTTNHCLYLHAIVSILHTCTISVVCSLMEVLSL